MTLTINLPDDQALVLEARAKAVRQADFGAEPGPGVASRILDVRCENLRERPLDGRD
jgi:hypothetical protein